MQAYRIKLEEIRKVLQEEPDKCELHLYHVGMLLEDENVWSPEKGDEKVLIDLKWSSIPSKEEIEKYEPFAPDAEYLAALSALVNGYRKKYSSWSKMVEHNPQMESAHSIEENGEPVFKNVDACIGTFVKELNMCLYEVKKGIYNTSFYPERLGFGTNHVGHRM